MTFAAFMPAFAQFESKDASKTRLVNGEHLASVYTAGSKQAIPNFSTSNSFKIIREERFWLYIRFEEPTVPVWVAKRFVTIEKDTVLIAAQRLNARLAPSMNSVVLTRLNTGYRSRLLESSGDFVKIYAPTNLTYAVHKSASEWNLMGKTNSNQQSQAIGNNAVPLATQVAKPNTDETVDTVETAAAVDNGNKQHQIASGEVISLHVFGEQDLSRDELKVPENGLLSFPLIGVVSVLDRTPQEVEVIIARELSKGYVRNPRVSVQMVRYRPIFVRGAVRNTGAIEFSPGLTLSKVLALAGGVTDSAQTDTISVERDAELVAKELSVDSQYAIQSGDVIIVKSELGAIQESGFVYLHGEVNNPGEYRFRTGLTVEKAIVLAGGFSIRGTRKKIDVTRYKDSEGAPDIIKRAELYLPVEPGDVIKVGARLF